MSERRKFPRIQLETVNITNNPLSHATITGWHPVGNDSEFKKCELSVYDISFLGLAFDSITELNKGAKIHLSLALGQADHIEASAEVVRIEEGKMAVKLVEVGAETHLAIDRFLQEKLVGHQMRLVTKRFYNPNDEFDFWFHGPKSTNLILWMSNHKIEKAFLENDEDIVVYENDHLTYRQSYEEAQGNGFSYEYEIDFDKEDKAPPPEVVRKFIQIIGHIPGHEELLNPVRNLLREQVH